MESKTCIVGLKHEGDIYIGADSCRTWGQMQEAGVNKVWFKNDMIYGASGLVRDIQIIKHKFNRPALQENEDIEHYLTTRYVDSLFESLEGSKSLHTRHGVSTYAANLLMGFRGKLYVITGWGSASEVIKPYNAIGSGTFFALGALHATEGIDMDPVDRVVNALKAACEYDMYVSEPLTVGKLDSDGKFEYLDVS